MRQEDLPKANANCQICGTPYYRCEKCIKLGQQGVMSWRLFCDTSRCYSIYSILEAYKKNLETKESAKKELSNIGDFPELTDETRAIVNEILWEKDENASVQKTVESYDNKARQNNKNAWKNSKKQNVK